MSEHEHAQHKEKTLVLNRVVMGHEPVAFDPESCIYIAGEWYTPDQWETLRDRIDKPLLRLGKIEARGGGVRSHGGHPILIHNLDYINEHRYTGRMKKAPWFLRWLYSGIITKEKLPEVG